MTQRFETDKIDRLKASIRKQLSKMRKSRQTAVNPRKALGLDFGTSPLLRIVSDINWYLDLLRTFTNPPGHDSFSTVLDCLQQFDKFHQIDMNSQRNSACFITAFDQPFGIDQLVGRAFPGTGPLPSLLNSFPHLPDRLPRVSESHGNLRIWRPNGAVTN